MEEEQVFLKSVLDYVSNKPIILPKLIAVLTQGLSLALESEKDRRLDVEIALVTALSKKDRTAGDAFLTQKLKEIQPYAFFNYESVVSKLEKLT